MTYPHYVIRLEAKEGETCIDLGCGDYRSEVAKQVLEMPFKKLVSVEGYETDFQNIPQAKAEIHDKVCTDIVPYLKEHEEKYDVGFAFDVIEHLKKEDGGFLLDWLDSHCKRIVLFVPDEPEGFHRVWNDGNKLQDHISYWREEDFTKRGFTVERCEKIHSDQQNGETIRFDALWVTKSQ
jgi:hypothetical protein